MTEPYEGYEDEGHPEDEVGSDDQIEPARREPTLYDRCTCSMPGRWCPVHDE